MVNLCDCMVPRFSPLLADKSRYLVVYGGAGSGKSVFASQKVILRCMGAVHRFAVFRKVARTLRQSVFRRLQAQCAEWKIPVKVNKSEMIISFRNGSEILFLGLDDAEKIKSIDGITSVWVEEATELTEDDLATIDMRLRGQTAWYKQILLTFNPISHMHWLKRRFFDNPSEGVTTVQKSTFADNPFLDDQYKQLFDDLRKRSPSLYRVYAEGEWGILKGLIFEPPEVIETYPAEFDSEAYGIDFGFNNPTTIMWVGMKDVDWNRRIGTIYAREELYDRELSNAELAERMKALGISRDTPIYADAAEPARIKELVRHGFRVIPANKGKGSLLAGIAMLRGFKIYTHQNNTNFNAEMATYSWQEDISGNLLEKPVPLNDHAIDALRYAVWSSMKRPSRAVQVS